jgi:hypothetical protein
VEEPQLSSTDTVGADGVLFGAEVPVPGELIHPLTVCVTVYVAAPDTVIDGDVAPVLHKSVPVYPVAVSVDVPQLSTTDTNGAGGAPGAALMFTLIDGAEVQDALLTANV